MSTALSRLLPRTVTRQIIFIIAVLGIIAAIANLTMSGYYEYKFLKRNMDATLTNQFQAVSRIFAEAVIYNNIYDLYTRAEAMVQFLDFVDNIYIFDGEGDYLTDAKVKKDFLSIADMPTESISVYNLDAGSERVGYVVYELHDRYIINMLTSHLTGLAIFGVLLLCVGIITGGIISTFLIKPLEQLSEELNKAASFPLKLKVPAHAPVEVRLLSDTLNNLSKTVNEQEKKIIRGEKLASIGTMAAGLAHQLKNPIMTIELLTHCISENRSTEEDIEVIRRESAHITKILNEFLTLSKPLNLTFTEYNASTLLKGLQSFTASRFQGEIGFTALLEKDFSITGDMQKITDIFTNLITNSYEAGTDSIQLLIYKSGMDAKIEIKDNGRGVPYEIKGSIFLPFYTSKASGTGLGLAYSEMVLEAMDGTIELAPSETGTCFVVTVPL